MKTRKIESAFAKQCREYMEGEVAYLGIRKDEKTGYVTGVKKSWLRRLLDYRGQ